MMEFLKKYTNNRTIKLILGGGGIGLILFVIIFGFDVLDVTNDRWILGYGGDLAQNYIGWMFYRNSSFNLSLGEYNTLTYPHYISIVFTDSLPLFSVFFKFFSFALPRPFQFTGLWGLVCFILQGAFSGLLIGKFTKSNILSLVLTVPFILAFPMLVKVFFHHSLAGQWLLMLMFNIWFYKIDNFRFNYKYILAFAGLGALASSIHIYWIPILALIVMGFCLNILLRYKDIKAALLIILSYIFGAVVLLFILGALKSGYVLTPSTNTLYELGANLNTLWNSWDTAAFIKGFPIAKPGQDEGVAYIGTGMWILFILAACIMIFDIIESIKKRKYNYTAISMAVISVLSLIAALGPTVSVNDKVLFTIPYPEFLIEKWAAFRGTGRFINVLFFIIYIYIIKTLLEFCSSNNSDDRAISIRNRKILTSIMCFCVFIQVIDLVPFLKQKRAEVEHEYENLIQDNAWDIFAEEGYEHIAAIPFSTFFGSFYATQDSYYIAHWAALNNITLNNFYLSRRLEEVDDIEEYKEKFEEGEIDDKTLYIVSYDRIDEFLDYPLHFYYIDELFVGTKEDLSGKIGIAEFSR